jgi:uncharacterized protein YecT (DUF1311 family)
MTRVRAVVAGLAVFAGFLSACSGESSSPISQQPARAERLAPPVIREQFTLLPCPRSRAARGTTVGAEGCLEKEILRTDAAINARAGSIFRLLRERTSKERFLAAEKAWALYRKASCTSVADVYSGGSARPVAFADCVVRRNRVHLKELTSFNDFLSGIY